MNFGFLIELDLRIYETRNKYDDINIPFVMDKSNSKYRLGINAKSVPNLPAAPFNGHKIEPNIFGTTDKNVPK